MKDILRHIIDNHGYVTSKDLEDGLVENYPNLPLVIKWSVLPRSIHLAKDVASVIKEKTNENNYAREVFLSANQLNTIKTIFNVDTTK